MDGQTRVKTLPSRRTTYAVGNNIDSRCTSEQRRFQFEKKIIRTYVVISDRLIPHSKVVNHALWRSNHHSCKL